MDPRTRAIFSSIRLPRRPQPQRERDARAPPGQTRQALDAWDARAREAAQGGADDDRALNTRDVLQALHEPAHRHGLLGIADVHDHAIERHRREDALHGVGDVAERADRGGVLDGDMVAGVPELQAEARDDVVRAHARTVDVVEAPDHVGLPREDRCRLLPHLAERVGGAWRGQVRDHHRRVLAGNRAVPAVEFGRRGDEVLCRLDRMEPCCRHGGDGRRASGLALDVGDTDNRGEVEAPIPGSKIPKVDERGHLANIEIAHTTCMRLVNAFFPLSIVDVRALWPARDHPRREVRADEAGAADEKAFHGVSSRFNRAGFKTPLPALARSPSCPLCVSRLCHRRNVSPHAHDVASTLTAAPYMNLVMPSVLASWLACFATDVSKAPSPPPRSPLRFAQRSAYSITACPYPLSMFASRHFFHEVSSLIFMAFPPVRGSWRPFLQ